MASDIESETVVATEPGLCPAGSECGYYQEVLTLREQVDKDPLTQLFNLRYFHRALEQELERTERTGLATAVMMIDLDHFKHINDNHGHEVGNKVLRQCARIIQQCTRRLDIQCRYGGEEFVVILPSTERNLALQVAQRLRQMIADHPLLLDDGSEIAVTASIGVALHSPEQPLCSQSLIEAADQQLYLAKHQGRDQVCCLCTAEQEVAVNSDEKALLGSMFCDSDDDHEDDFIAAEDDCGEDYMQTEQAADWDDDSWSA